MKTIYKYTYTQILNTNNFKRTYSSFRVIQIYLHKHLRHSVERQLESIKKKKKKDKDIPYKWEVEMNVKALLIR